MLIGCLSSAFAWGAGVSLTWQVSSSPDVKAQVIYYGTDRNVYQHSITISDNTTAAYTVTGLVVGQRYCFSIKASTAGFAQFSRFSNQACGIAR